MFQMKKSNLSICGLRYISKNWEKLALVKIESGKASAVDELRVEMEILDIENQLLQLIDNCHFRNLEQFYPHGGRCLRAIRERSMNILLIQTKYKRDFKMQDILGEQQNV